jgi:hypothetical protein
MCVTPLHDRINPNLVGAPNCRGPLVLELTLTTVRYATVPNPFVTSTAVVLNAFATSTLSVVTLKEKVPPLKAVVVS